jgi:hypothetical protein
MLTINMKHIRSEKNFVPTADMTSMHKPFLML